MNKGIWIHTTTAPDGFDIFRWTVWLQSATLAELYVELGRMETLCTMYRTGWDKVSEQRAQLSANLHHLIDMEICDRLNVDFRPQNLN